MCWVWWSWLMRSVLPAPPVLLVRPLRVRLLRPLPVRLLRVRQTVRLLWVRQVVLG